MACGEFSLIARYFDRVRHSRRDVETGIGDDCALLNVPEKTDAGNKRGYAGGGQPLLPDIDPADLAYKALAVNLSDLAAVGADPAWMTLALTLPEADDALGCRPSAIACLNNSVTTICNSLAATPRADRCR